MSRSPILDGSRVAVLGCAFLGMILTGCGSSESSSADLLKKKQLRDQQKEQESLKSSEARLATAKRLFGEKRYAPARDELVFILVEEKDNPEVLKLAARCEAGLGNTDDALKFIDRAIEVSPETFVDSQWLASEWHIEAGDFQGARERIERLLERDPEMARAHRRLANLLNSQGLRFLASKHLKKLTQLGVATEKELFAMKTYAEPFLDESIPMPDDGELRPSLLARAKRLHVEKEYRSSAFLLQRLSEAFAENTAIAAFRGRVLADLHDDSALTQWASELPKGIEQEPEYWSALGSWMQYRGQHQEAVRCFLEAVLRDETDRASVMAMAASLQVLGEDGMFKDRETLDRILEHFELLQEASEITGGFGAQRGTMMQLDRLATLLDELNRPFEAVGWRLVSHNAHGGTPTDLKSLDERRRTLLTVDMSDEPRTHFFGLNPKDWPLPNLGVLESAGPTDVPLASSSDFNQSRPIALSNVASEAKLDFQYVSGDDPSDPDILLHQLTGGGIGVVDFDQDGNPDLYLGQSGGAPLDPNGSQPNALFRNLAGKVFANVAPLAGVSDLGYAQGIAVGDLNQDGLPDLAVANIGRNRYFKNNGDGTFSKWGGSAMEQSAAWTTSIAIGDVSGDHLPEIFEVNYVDDPRAYEITCTPDSQVCNPSEFRPAVDEVWTVGPDGEIAVWKGCESLSRSANFGFGSIIANFDGVHGNDVFVVNDVKKNQFWKSLHNDEGERVLRDVSTLIGCGYGLAGDSNGGMGIAAGDFDRNGLLDLHVTNFWNQPADLYLLQPGGLFANRTVQMGTHKNTRRTVGWGTQAIDLDRDGWLDLPVLNGHVMDMKNSGMPFEMKPQLFQGTPSGFQIRNSESIQSDYFDRAAHGRALAVLDWNSDHRLDFVAGELAGPTALLENRTQGGHSISLELVGTVCERDAIGAKVTVTGGGQTWTTWQTGGDGFLVSNQSLLHVGLGDLETVDRIVVEWPNSATQAFTDLAADSTYLIVEGADGVFVRAP